MSKVSSGCRRSHYHINHKYLIHLLVLLFPRTDSDRSSSLYSNSSHHSTWMVFLNFELYNDDATWLPHSGCTPVALPCFLVTHKTRPAAINIARAM